MNSLSVFLDAWRSRHKMGDDNQTRELAEFLPAALEIQQAPANPLAKWLGRCLMLLFTLGMIWASVGEVNQVASAEGKIIPSSRIKQIQPIEKAVVKAILVSEGQHVNKFQPLIELDSALTNAEENRLNSELKNAWLLLAIKTSLLQLLDSSIAQQQKTTLENIEFTVPTIANLREQHLYKRLLWQQWRQYLGQLHTLQNALSETRAQQNVTQETLIKLEQTLPIIIKRVNKVKTLYDKQFIAETEYLNVEQQRIEKNQDLAAERYQLKKLKASEAGVKEQIKTLNAQTKTTALTELTDLKRQIASLQEELAKAADLNAKQILYAPVSGQVQGLAINTVGGVVMEAQQLMLIVPDEQQLEVEVFLENKDIGFVQKGMEAEVKIHTFPFTKYGVIEGEVTSVSNDATADEQRGLIYGMHLLMKKNTISIGNREVRLMPGMAVTVEVKTGTRRIIEFFLAPLIKHGKESLRER